MSGNLNLLAFHLIKIFSNLMRWSLRCNKTCSKRTYRHLIVQAIIKIWKAFPLLEMLKFGGLTLGSGTYPNSWNEKSIDLEEEHSLIHPVLTNLTCHDRWWFYLNSKDAMDLLQLGLECVFVQIKAHWYEVPSIKCPYVPMPRFKCIYKIRFWLLLPFHGCVRWSLYTLRF